MKVNWLRVIHLHLGHFWDRFGGKHSNGIGFSKEEKIAALIAEDKMDFSQRHAPSIEERRQFFDDKKFGIHSLKHFRFCFACGKSASCRHHIIPLSKGGINKRRNIVSLCGSCHSEIHPWL